MRTKNTIELTKELERLKKKCCCAESSGDSCCYEEVTYAEAAARVASASLVPNKLYKISDRGDLGIFLEAISTTEFNQEGSRLMLIPNWECYTAFSIYYESRSYNENDEVIWDGVVWRNLTGNNTHVPGQDTVDWLEIEKDLTTQSTTCEDTVYKQNWFGVVYDFENDWISKQWDDRGNVFGIAFNHAINYSLNPVDVSDWWIAQGEWVSLLMYDNVCLGIWNNYCGSDSYVITNNKINGAIYENIFASDNTTGISYNTNSGNIYSNNCGRIVYNSNLDNIEANVCGEIKYNSNLGDIEGNIVDIDLVNMDISYNRNSGSIFGNTNEGLIFNNSNNGSISNNANLGEISTNSNNGYIDSCTSDPNSCDIINNINNGNISGAFVADVTDTIVNKP